MKQAAMAQGPIKLPGGSFLSRTLYVFLALALFSVAINLGGKWLGRTIALAGHTEDTTPREIVIGNNVLSVPANAIRFEKARHDGIAPRLDLYLRWPDMEGYSQAARDDFNNAGGSRRILFLSFEPRTMSRDMSGRFAPIYSQLIRRPGTPDKGGLELYDFKEKTGYVNEVLAVAARPNEEPYVARCLTGPSAEESLAPCERDIHLGDDLSLTYRFPRELLADWPSLEAAVSARAAQYLKTGR